MGEDAAMRRSEGGEERPGPEGGEWESWREQEALSSMGGVEWGRQRLRFRATYSLRVEAVAAHSAARQGTAGEGWREGHRGSRHSQAPSRIS